MLVARLVWDAWNTEHIARHSVTLDEVEEICQGNSLVQQSRHGRLLVSGKTTAGRFLVVILASTLAPGAYYPVTAYPASGKYRRIYEQEKGKEEIA